MTWALLHLVLGLPLNLLLPQMAALTGKEHSDGEQTKADVPPNSGAQPRRHIAYLMAYVFAVSWFISTAMAAHLPQLLQSTGVAWRWQSPLALLRWSVRHRWQGVWWSTDSCETPTHCCPQGWQFLRILLRPFHWGLWVLLAPVFLPSCMGLGMES